jgi:hypothetical protein
VKLGTIRPATTEIKMTTTAKPSRQPAGTGKSAASKMHEQIGHAQNRHRHDHGQIPPVSHRLRRTESAPLPETAEKARGTRGK